VVSTLPLPLAFSLCFKIRFALFGVGTTVMNHLQAFAVLLFVNFNFHR